MKLFRFQCGCVGLKPRVCVDKPNLLKMVRFYDCKKKQYGMEDIVTSRRPYDRLSPAAEGVAVRQLQEVIAKGREA